MLKVVFFLSLIILTLVYYGKQDSAPDCVLATFKNCQLVETIKVWYVYKDKIKANLGHEEFLFQDPIGYNQNYLSQNQALFSLSQLTCIWNNNFV